MTLKEKLKWDGAIANRLATVERTQCKIAAGKASKAEYYWFVGEAHGYAIECYRDGDAQKSKEAAKLVVHAALEYFYGDWRKILATPDGTTGHEEWKPFCLWYEEVMRSLPWACALADWAAIRRIAEYPPENKLPKASKAIGETAWGWALITFLRDQPRKQVEQFLLKAETHKAKRPQLLCPVLRSLLNNDAVEFESTLLAYLAYYRTSEFKRDLDKVLALDGATLCQLGRKQGFDIQPPETWLITSFALNEH
jgi:hypothetical protein